MMSSKLSKSGFTLIEMLMVIALISILGGLGLSFFMESPDAQRYEATRAEMEQIQRAILGDHTVTNQGHRGNFGYVGDWGSLPAAITNINTAQVPAWAFNTTYGLGVGWHGPYMSGVMNTADYTEDAWDRAYIWTPGASPATLVSRGADGAAGGTGYNTDLTINIPTTMWRADVFGTVLNGNVPQTGVTVEIRYPVNGVLTAFTDTTGADGAYSFANVPFGVRSMAVTTVPTLGPFIVIVDNNQLQVPINYFK